MPVLLMLVLLGLTLTVPVCLMVINVSNVLLVRIVQMGQGTLRQHVQFFVHLAPTTHTKDLDIVSTVCCVRVDVLALAPV